MSAELYSTNPSLVGGLLIVGGASMATRPELAHQPAATWPWIVIALGYLSFAVALHLTRQNGLADLMMICAGISVVPSALAAYWLWPTAYHLLAVICLAAIPALVLWAVIGAWTITRAAKGR